ncbi:MAG: hypothetical protein QXD11_01230 [Candidatus Micrarchaeaceae archaeon]
MPSYGMFVLAAIIVASASISCISYEENNLYKFKAEYIIYRNENMLNLINEYICSNSYNNNSFMQILNTCIKIDGLTISKSNNSILIGTDYTEISYIVACK